MNMRTTNSLRNKLTQNLLNRVMERSEKGFNCEDVLMDIAYDPKQPADLRIRAATQLTNLIFPKAQSVEVTADVTTEMSIEQMDQRLAELIKLANGGIKAEVELG